MTALTSAVHSGTRCQSEPSDVYELWQPREVDDGAVKSMVAYSHEPSYTVLVGAARRRLPTGHDAVSCAQRKNSKPSLHDQTHLHIVMPTPALSALRLQAVWTVLHSIIN